MEVVNYPDNMFLFEDKHKIVLSWSVVLDSTFKTVKFELHLD